MAAKIKNLQLWCKRQCEGYRDVDVTNMTSSWKSGLAFCAIIHRYRPDIIDYDSLSKENVFDNNKLAFDVAQNELDIAALLDAEDMVTMTVPDKLCIVTYVAQYYNYFRDKDPVGGPGVRECRSTRAPTKRPSTTQPHISAPEVKKSTTAKTSPPSQRVAGQKAPIAQPVKHDNQGEPPAKRGTYGDTCHLCKKKVYLMERHIEGSKLYHRRCFRDKQRSEHSSTQSPPLNNSYLQWPSSDTDKNKNIKQNKNTYSSASSDTDKNKSMRQDRPTYSSSSALPSASKPVTSASRSGIKSDNDNKTTAQSSLVKMLYGGPASYGAATSTIGSEKTDKKTGAVGDPINSSSRETSSTVGQKFKSSALKVDPPVLNKSQAKPQTVSQRATLFDNAPKPKFGSSLQSEQTKPVSVGSARSSITQNITGWKNQENHKPEPMEIEISLPDRHKNTSTVTTSIHRAASPLLIHNQNAGGPDKDTAMKLGLFHSLANVRQQKASNSDSVSTSSSTSSSNIKVVPTNMQQGKNECCSFLGSKSAHSSNPVKTEVGSNNTSDKMGGVSSILKSRNTSEGLDSSGADKSSHRLILKPVSPRQSIDASACDIAGPRPILKSRLFDEHESQPENDPKPILKRKSLEDAESGITPKPILKSMFPTEPNRSRSTSPHRSILKSNQDTSPTNIAVSSSESKPKSILKQMQESLSGKQTERVTSPTRSILKQSGPGDGDKVTGVHDESVGRPPSEVIIPAPRSKLKINKTNDEHQQDNDSKSHKSQISNFALNQNPDSSKSKDLSTSHKSILNPGKDAGHPKSSPGASWQVASPQMSTGTPFVSSSTASTNKSGDSSSGGSAVNNFSAFNLQDSLLIHDCPSTGTTTSKTNTGPTNRINSAPKVGMGISIDKGKVTHPKPSWQIEMEARTGLKQTDTKSKQPPSRPTAPPRTSKQTSESKSQTDDKNTTGKASWQLEAEKRQAARQGKYEDPEFRRVKKDTQASSLLKSGPNTTKLNTDLSHNKSKLKVNVTKPKAQNRHSIGNPIASSKSEFSKIQDQYKLGNKGQSESDLRSPPPRPPPMHKITPDDKSKMPGIHNNYEIIKESPTSSPSTLLRSPAFRISDSPGSSPESAPKNNGIKSNEIYLMVNGDDSSQGTKRKILPEAAFTFRSGDFEFGQPKPGGLSSGEPSPRSPASWIQQRPLPTPPSSSGSPPKRQVYADARMAPADIAHELIVMDEQLRQIEDEGRSLEDQIRSVSEDDMDQDHLMVQWFDIVSRKNELVRKESDLAYKQRQQELEDVHTDLEHELRLLMTKPEYKKTASEKVREQTLMQELLETVDQRNNIVDSMEEDRIRYIEEDKDIAEKMANTSLAGSDSDKKKKKKHDKKKKHKGAKDIAEENNHTNKENGVKEKKLFGISLGFGAS